MYQEIISWKNLLLAFKRAAKGKRGHPNVAAFEYRLEENLFQLQVELNDHTYVPGEYYNFFIHEPKRRLISAAPFRDRVVHHALCNPIEPIFERSFIFDSYANRIGKGTHRALNRAQEFARKFKYVLTCDIQTFFPAIDHMILIKILKKKIKDKGVNWLIRNILEKGKNVLHDEYRMQYFPGDDLFAVNRPRGLPIGNLTSQFWANCYLNPFDHFIKRELNCLGYIRYVDDFLLFSNSKQQLWKWKTNIIDRLSRFRLILHPHCHPYPVTEGIPFLGFKIFPERRLLKNRKGIYFRRKIKKKMNDLRKNHCSPDEFFACLCGWLNHISYANTFGLRFALARTSIHFVPKKYQQHFLECIYGCKNRS